MAKYIDADLLLKEINRRIELLTKAELDWSKQGDTETVLYYSGKSVALNEFTNFIDSLSREQPSLPSDVDEAARKYGHEKPILPEGYNDGDIPLYERWTADAFKAGAEWKTGQMEVMEGEVVATSTNGWESIRIYKKLHSVGDKVTVQIQKKQQL